MKKIILIICFFSFVGVIAQNSEMSGQVMYEYQLNPSKQTLFYKVNSILEFTEKESLYEIDRLQKTSKTKPQTEFTLTSKENEFIYKNSTSQEMFFTDKIDMKKFIIKDSLNLMDWALTSNTKEILGYKCQEAYATYGGRSYLAYYASDIPVSNGPWRFQGLPGLILEVHSVDGVFNLTAKSLKITDKKIAIENPFENKKTLSWEEFLALYRKKYDEVLRNNMTEYGPSQELAKRGIVEYIKE